MNKATLEINNLVLPLNIGLTEQERSVPQDININIKITFNSLPKACYSDNIDETICYERLVTLIKEFCKNNQFKLIENLTFKLHNYIQGLISDNSVELTISKKPPIDSIKGNCSFTLC